MLTTIPHISAKVSENVEWNTVHGTVVLEDVTEILTILLEEYVQVGIFSYSLSRKAEVGLCNVENVDVVVTTASALDCGPNMISSNTSRFLRRGSCWEGSGIAEGCGVDSTFTFTLVLFN